jgi:hypothetical protein
MAQWLPFAYGHTIYKISVVTTWQLRNSHNHFSQQVKRLKTLTKILEFTSVTSNGLVSVMLLGWCCSLFCFYFMKLHCRFFYLNVRKNVLITCFKLVTLHDTSSTTYNTTQPPSAPTSTNICPFPPNVITLLPTSTFSNGS